MTAAVLTPGGRGRAALFVGAAAALGVLDAGLPADLTSFAGGGKAIVTGHLAIVYANPGTQAGPVQLVLSWLLMIGSDGNGPTRLGAAALNAAVMIGAITLCRRTAQSTPSPDSRTEIRAKRHEIVIGVLVLLWLTPGPLWDGHPVELLVAALWLAAVSLVDAKRWVVAGVALGITAAIAPWGVLGFPALLACRHRRRAYPAVVLGGAVAVLAYVPFVLTGHFALFDYTWLVNPHSLIHLFAPGQRRMSWVLRVVQAVVIVAGTAGAAALVRRRGATPAVAVLVAAVLRVATDPLQLNYYWTSVGVAAITIAATTAPSRRAWWAAAVAYAAWAGATLGWTVETAGLCLALAVPIAAFTATRSPAASPSAEDTLTRAGVAVSLRA